MSSKSTSIKPSFSINLRGRLLFLDAPKVMGILNITPDSFYSGSRYTTEDAVLKKAAQMLQEGATFLDIGGQSTRPGAALLTPEEEAARVLPHLKNLVRHFPQVFISVDTYHAKVAKAALENGAHLINDISAGEMDREMISVVGAMKAPYIAMHMKGTPVNMQKDPHYENVYREIFDYFVRKIEACKTAGINDIIIDPGFGFGKSLSHNYELLHHLDIFKLLEMPILAGVSRKSMIYKLLEITPEEALNGTTAINLLALQKGVHILRVHDIKPAVELVRLWQYYEKNE